MFQFKVLRYNDEENFKRREKEVIGLHKLDCFAVISGADFSRYFSSFSIPFIAKVRPVGKVNKTNSKSLEEGIIKCLDDLDSSFFIKVYVDISIGNLSDVNHGEKNESMSNIYFTNMLLIQEYCQCLNIGDSISLGGVNANDETSIFDYCSLYSFDNLFPSWKSITLRPISPLFDNISVKYISNALNGMICHGKSVIRVPFSSKKIQYSSSIMNSKEIGSILDVNYFAEFIVDGNLVYQSEQGIEYPSWGIIDGNHTIITIYTYDQCLDHDNPQFDMLKPIMKQDEQASCLIQILKYSFSPNSQSHMNGIKPPHTILISGPRGIGKTCLIKYACRDLGVKLIQVTPSDIYATQYKGQDVTSNLTSFIEKALAQSPCLVLIDELESIFPNNTDEKDTHLVNEMVQLMKQLSYDSPFYNGIILCGICNQLNELDISLQNAFEEQIEIDIPSPSERTVIIQNMIESLQKQDSGEFTKERIEWISAKCHGFIPTDIQTMFQYAVQKATNRFMEEFDHSETSISIQFSDIIDFFLHGMEGNAYKPYSILQATNQASITIPQIPQVKWEDIGGLKSVKQQLQEMIVWPLKHQDAFLRMGITPPTGLLLYGPPGTGKTLLAKAVASAASSNFIAINIPDLIKAEIGESEKTLAQIFRRARLASPCVIFFDEIQAMFGDRNEVSGGQHKLVSQLLLEMDGLYQFVQTRKRIATSTSDTAAMNDKANDSKLKLNHHHHHHHHIVVIAATNVPQKLDPSLLRPGRFDRIVYVGPPDSEARKHILMNKLKGMKVSLEVSQSIDEIVQKTDQFSGADVVNICNQAGLNALLDDTNATIVSKHHFLKAIETTPVTISENVIHTFENWSTRTESIIQD